MGQCGICMGKRRDSRKTMSDELNEFNNDGGYEWDTGIPPLRRQHGGKGRRPGRGAL